MKLAETILVETAGEDDHDTRTNARRAAEELLEDARFEQRLGVPPREVARALFERFVDALAEEAERANWQAKCIFAQEELREVEEDLARAKAKAEELQAKLDRACSQLEILGWRRLRC